MIHAMMYMVWKTQPATCCKFAFSAGATSRTKAAAAAAIDHRYDVRVRSMVSNCNPQLHFHGLSCPPFYTGHIHSASRRRTFVTSFVAKSSSPSRPSSNTVVRENQQRHIPPPTWSIRDLKLTSTHPPVSQEEFERLSRLALIDVSYDHGESQVDSLKQELGNMLKMIQHVAEHNYPPPLLDVHVANNKSDDDPTYIIYDKVRGVKEIPLRKGINDDLLQEQDADQARKVWETLLRAKTIRRGGGHVYFAIKTDGDSSDENSFSNKS